MVRAWAVDEGMDPSPSPTRSRSPPDGLRRSARRSPAGSPRSSPANTRAAPTSVRARDAPERAETLAARLARGRLPGRGRARLRRLPHLGLSRGARPTPGSSPRSLRSPTPTWRSRSLARIAEAMRPADRAEFLDALRQREGLRIRLLAVLGASLALGDSLVRRPADWHVLAEDAMASMRPTRLGLERSLLDADRAVATGRAAYDALRRRLSTAAARSGGPRPHRRRRCRRRRRRARRPGRGDPVDAALRLATAETGVGPDVRLAVIGMGKCGGRELNYVSDVDVIFVAEPGEQPARRRRSPRR